MKIGYHAVYDKGYSDALRYGNQNGFDYVQFDLGVPRFFFSRATKTQLNRIRSFLEENDLGISFHTPGDNIGMFIDYDEIRTGLLTFFKRLLKTANFLNARHITVHPSIYPTFRRSDTGRDSYEKEHWKYYSKILYENLNIMADAARDVMICVENFKFSKLVMETLEKLFSDGVPIYLAYDLAKGFQPDMTQDRPVHAFFKKYIDRVKELHIHDLKKKTYKSHFALGKGDIDFGKFKPFYKQEDVWATIEVRPRQEALRSKAAFLKVLDKI